MCQALERLAETKTDFFFYSIFIVLIYVVYFQISGHLGQTIKISPSHLTLEK